MSASIVGSVSWHEFILLTLIFFGWIGYMTAASLGRTWRPAWHNVAYGFCLAGANRLLEMMLFQGDLSSLRGFLVASGYLIVVMLLSYRITVTKMMVTQYPWLYERTGLLGWREKSAG
ncbi:MAG: DUF6867 family protein [Elsteraceae bacterium]